MYMNVAIGDTDLHLLTVRETAYLLRVNPITVRRYIADGRLTAVRVGKGVRVSKEAIDQFLAPIEPSRVRNRNSRIPRGKPFTTDDSLWHIVGLGQSSESTDVAEHKHAYLADAYTPQA